MKVTLTLSAVCLVLLCTSVTAFPPRISHWRINPVATTEVDRFIPPAAADLFNAIFNLNVPLSNPVSDGLGAQRCVDLHNIVYHNTVNYTGRDIRNSVKIQDSSIRRYLEVNDAELLQQQFVAIIDQCGASPSAEQRRNCYADAIVGVFTDINASSREPFFISKSLIRYRLESLSWNLYAESITLEKCLSAFPQDTTLVPPEGLTTASPAPSSPESTTPAAETSTETPTETTNETETSSNAPEVSTTEVSSETETSSNAPDGTETTQTDTTDAETTTVASTTEVDSSTSKDTTVPETSLSVSSTPGTSTAAPTTTTGTSSSVSSTPGTSTAAPTTTTGTSSSVSSTPGTSTAAPTTTSPKTTTTKKDDTSESSETDETGETDETDETDETGETHENSESKKSSESSSSSSSSSSD